MEHQPIPVAVIGLGAFGCQTLQALQQVQAVKVVGVADKDSATAAQVGKTFGVPSYGDNRSLLAETHPMIVYLAVPPMAAPELIATCAERGIHVWKELPLARNLDEGVSMIRRMDQAGLKFAVGTQRRFARTYRRACELRERVGQVFLARAHYLFYWGPTVGWRGDRASAGGGALLELGYHSIDLLVWMLGLPDDVYGISTGGKRSATQTADAKSLPPYDTDDTSAALMRYAGGCMAGVVTTRRSGPVSEELSLHGLTGSMSVSSDLCLLRSPDGAVLDRTPGDARPQDVFVRQAEAFAKAVSAEARTYECSARENLLNLAVIEAVYLSDRTGQPESPLRLLKTHNLTVKDCLVHRTVVLQPVGGDAGEQAGPPTGGGQGPP
jgi:predicted dehydrogenase